MGGGGTEGSDGMDERRMCDVGELGVLRGVLPGLRQGADVVRGPGDDCAVLRVEGWEWDLLATSDPVIEGHHYVAGTPWEWVGRKAVGRSVSDIAAMGGTARWVLTDVTAPAGMGAGEVGELYRGLEKAARELGVSIVGGDLAAAGEVQVHVMALGTCGKGMAVLRSGARAGDVVFVTGRLGASWAEGNPHQFLFEPRLREGRWLAEKGFAGAMMDISDGLGKDLPRLLDASGGLGCEIWPGRLPCSEAAMRAGGEPARHAWEDGEDFELLFTVRPEKRGALEAEWAAAFPELELTAVGVVRGAGEGRVFAGEAGTRAFPDGGFEHFK